MSFQTLSTEERRRIASMGGQAAHASGNGRKWTSEEASAAGSKGGQVMADRPGHMSELGRKGAAAMHAARRVKKNVAALADAIFGASPELAAAAVEIFGPALDTTERSRPPAIRPRVRRTPAPPIQLAAVNPCEIDLNAPVQDFGEVAPVPIQTASERIAAAEQQRADRRQLLLERGTAWHERARAAAEAARADEPDAEGGQP